MGLPQQLDTSTRYADMTLVRGVKHAPDEATAEIIRKLLFRIKSVTQEHEVFRAWCDRADRMYFPETVNDKNGSDVWPEHESAKINGRQHVSLNEFAPYVDIPATMQAEDPIENMLASGVDTDGKTTFADEAAAEERAYTAWKQAEDLDLKFHKIITVKGLYGRTAGRIYWDPDEGRPCVEVIAQPRNLYMGWKTDNFEQLEWAAYRMYYEPNALTEEFGVEVTSVKSDGDVVVPFVQQRSWDEDPVRPWTALGDARVEVWDYWYRQPVWKGNRFVRMDTYNVVVAGNIVLRPPTKYAEYKGKLPYVPLFNTFVPGMPNGRPDLYDVEPLIRETMERITNGSQAIANATSGDAFQLIGPDAPMRVPQGLKPVKGGVVAPGAGNRLEVIAPFIAQFQLEQFLGRIDRHKTIITGLNELLLGLAPAQVLSSSKAINALISNYEARLSMRRKLLYKWRRDTWLLARQVGVAKSKLFKDALPASPAYLDITSPSLNPRDELETMTRALNGMNGKLWSQRRAMDAVGVDDPETEQDYIRQERTDATLFPADVQVMAQLLGALQSLGLNAPAGAQAQAQGQANSGQEALAQSLGAAAPSGLPGGPGSGAGGDQAIQAQTPPVAGANSAVAGQPLVSGPPGNQPVMQGMLQNGQAKGRIMTQQKLGRR